MEYPLLQKLSEWQKQQAAREGVEPYKVVPFVTLQAIAAAVPKTKEELCAIKGFKEARFHKYGRALLAITGGTAPVVTTTETLFDEMDRVQTFLETKDREAEAGIAQAYSVSDFLDVINGALLRHHARVRGEVVSVDARERVVYFTLKDKEGESVLNCLIFRSTYDIAGVSLEEGQDVIVEGVPEIYKPSGRFSVKVQMIEVAGEGALKKAYEVLKKKLAAEGLFAPERKRDMPLLPRVIGLITSREGAAIGDFTTNVGQYGYRIEFIHSSVEGKRAVVDLLSALKTLRTHAVDVVVIVRGGGSLESLQAFNNETLVRAIADFPVPVVCGIGHEQDETIATLVADVGVSTPTAAARAVRASWDAALQRMEYCQRTLFTHFTHMLSGAHHAVSTLAIRIVHPVENLLLQFRHLQEKFLYSAHHRVPSLIGVVRERLAFYEKTLFANDPHRQLQLGYSIARVGGKVVRSVAHVRRGDTMDVRVADGTIVTTVNEGTIKES
ncbi:exodeoxyribonuclease VII large subunit [Candidatus Kaiserbacteria bacterium RIFCSPHIGHO2_01_FULL_54_36b]|uniref:Exodeoxyribonuclease 7 large subunit n=1 Tax=Candidatus Kaiserbacteria bacterium RIFCSPHIGHO2_01_FULL_54_36b TaxID=1798483 RepID=A0A1F6CKF8_9BACT|nr:MAG: exodeoxyribonuclease VII large subunit [Candidatus Kaiserbacteria bacterium RIFCSPHIGHO2_01_FULL_54_36b]